MFSLDILCHDNYGVKLANVGNILAEKYPNDFARWLLSEKIMQESVIYQDIVQQEAGFLNRRFGDINSSLTEPVQVLSAQTLEDLGEALLEFSNIADLEAWLNQPEGD